MNRLETNFAGLSLKNPIIVSSSGLTDSAEKCLMLEQAGAGAVVLKSIFEEQIMQEYDRWNDVNVSEGHEYLDTYLRMNSLNEYVELIKEAKRVCSIPVIASINCNSRSEWGSFAQLVEDAGADALELNIMQIQTEREYVYGTSEQVHIDILDEVKKHTRLPIIMKLGLNLSCPIALIDQLYANGVAAVVLFNRPYRPDVNINSLSFSAGEMWTRPSDICESLRWTAIASAKVPMLDYAVSGGVHDGWAVVKAVLTGASVVEICTTIYQNGMPRIGTMKVQLEEWMIQHGYKHLNQFKGRLNSYAVMNPNVYERTQFMRYYSQLKSIV